MVVKSAIIIRIEKQLANDLIGTLENTPHHVHGGILPLRDLPRTVAICLESQYVHITAGHMPAQIVEQQADLHLQKALIRCGEHIVAKLKRLDSPCVV